MLLSPFVDGRTSSVVDSIGIYWSPVAGLYLGSDNLDVASCYAVALDGSNNPIAPGTKVFLPFTVDGGAPLAVGATVWLASSFDDSATGRAKVTATVPSPAISFNYAKQQVAIVGTVISLTNFGTGGAPKYAVMLGVIQPSSGVAPVPPDTSFTFNGVLFPSTSNFSCTVATTNQVDILDNQSMVYVFGIDDLSTSSPLTVPIAAYGPGAATGYQLVLSASGTGLTFSPRAGGPDIGFPTLPGRNVIAISRYGGNFRVSVNGQNVQTTGDGGGDMGAGGTFTLRNRSGANYSIVKLNRTMTDAQLIAASTSQISFAPGTNPFAPDAALAADAACQYRLDLTTYISGTPHATAGAAGTAFDFTVAGSPTVRTTTLNYLNSPAALVHDGPTPTYGNGHVSTARAAMRIGFTVQNQADFANIAIGGNNTDNDNSDEGSACIYINGAPVVAAQTLVIGTDGVTRWTNPVGYVGGALPQDPALWAGLTAPYHVEIEMGDRIPRIDTFDSGLNITSICIPSTAVMDSTTTTSRMLFTADGYTLGNHQNDLISASALSGSVEARVRADFNGRVTCNDIMPNWSFKFMRAWGDGTVVPYAKYKNALAQEGSPTTRTHAILMGRQDWDENVPLATFTADYGLYIDTLHALDPTANIVILKDPHTVQLTMMNGLGTLFSAFITATDGLAAGRAWLAGILDVTGPTTIPWLAAAGNRTPLLPTGPPALKDNIKTAMHSVLPTVY